jgi:hypothetical protein
MKKKPPMWHICVKTNQLINTNMNTNIKNDKCLTSKHHEQNESKT